MLSRQNEVSRRCLQRVVAAGLPLLVLLVGCSGSAASGQPGAGGPSVGGGSGGSAQGGRGGSGGQLPGEAGSSGSSVGASGGSGGHAGNGGSGATGGPGGSGGSSGADAGAGGAAVGGSGGAGGTAGNGGASGGAAGALAAGGAIAVLNPAAPPKALTLSGSLGAHDPTIIQSGTTYYLFRTGTNIPVKRSTDLLNWQEAGRAFATQPAWMAASGVPFDSNNTMWAPDVSFFNDQYHLYYSVSAFGQNSSCIGHATRASLETGAWEDQGSVICTTSQSNYNAIDPNIVLDTSGTPWMSFGSFWSGIQLIRLTPTGARDGTEITRIAGGRPSPNAIEAPVIVRRGAFYYLFVSFDLCCQNANSTYKLAVGRASEVQGPYVDKAGTDMLSGGGTVFLRGSEGNRTDTIPYAAVGHNAILLRGNEAFNVYHAYPETGGGAVLRIAELAWDAEGWPVSGGP